MCGYIYIAFEKGKYIGAEQVCLLPPVGKLPSDCLSQDHKLKSSSASDETSQLKAQTRTWILHYGRKIILQVQKLMGRYSLIGDHQFFDPAMFPWAGEVEAGWGTIRAELDMVMRHRDALPDFQEISPDQKHIATENKWKTFFFFAYGLRSEENLRRCPGTARLLDNIPGVKTAFFSILSG